MPLNLSLCGRIAEVPRVPGLRRCKAGKCRVPAFPAQLGSLVLSATLEQGHAEPLRAVLQIRLSFTGDFNQVVQADRRHLLEMKGQDENCLQR